MAKIVVVGIDGIPWAVLEPFIKKGLMPNVKRLLSGGCRGILESCIPSSTFPAWKCYSTGKNAGKFGVFARTATRFSEKRVVFTGESNCFESREFWDLIGDSGKKVAIINMPTTYPPRKVNGFLAASSVPNNSVEYTYPKSLQGEIEEKFGYKPDPEVALDVEGPELKKEFFSLIESRFLLAKHLIDSVDFLQVTVVCTDYMLHFHWKSRFVESVLEKIDKELGLLIEKAGGECNFIIMSDHGFAPLKARFFANTWLQQNGYQETKERVSKTLFSLGLNRDMVASVLKRIGMYDAIRATMPEKVRKQLKSKHGLVGGVEKTPFLDWDASRVVCEADDLFYINPACKERGKLRDELSKKLLEIRFPATGERVISKVLEKNQVYSGKFLDIAPDLVTIACPDFEVAGSLGSKELFGTDSVWKANHHRDGIFVINGQGIKRGQDIGRVSLFDLAPTILHLMNLPAPKDYDGRVLEEVFEQG